MIEHGPYGFEHVNAAQQRRDPNSLLNWMERMIRMRKEVPEIGWGDFTLIDCGEPGIFALRYDWRDNSALFVHNLTNAPAEIVLRPGVRGSDDSLLVNLLSSDHSESEGGDTHRIVMEGYGYRWYRVGGLDYLLRRAPAGR